MRIVVADDLEKLADRLDGTLRSCARSRRSKKG
jgi:hypothetical protein